jgi:membrane-bound ClpP family serine protease
MIGLIGRCESTIEPISAGDPSASKGKVFVRGEYWNCTAGEPIGVGESVEIISIEGLTLRVRKATQHA